MSHRTVMKTKRNQRSLANLRPFKSGEEWTGNAGGRPRRKPLTEALEAIYANPLEALAAAKAMALKIRRGDPKAFAEVANRLEGKVQSGETVEERSIQVTRVIVLDVPRPDRTKIGQDSTDVKSTREKLPNMDSRAR